MRKNKELNALEALDVSPLLKTVYYDTAFDLVSGFLKHAFSVVLEEVEEAQSIPLDCHYTVSEEYKKVKDGLNSLCSIILELQAALLQGIGLPCIIKKDSIIDIKPLLLLLSQDEFYEVIDMCLKYVDESMEIKTKCNHDSNELEELKTSLIAIRDEDLKIIEEEKTF